jgi:signal transduction histidine kinase
MNLNRVDVKLGATIILLFLVVLLPLGFVIDQIFSGFYYNKVQEETDQLSSRYANILAQNRNSMTIHMIKMMAEFSEITLFITDPQGKIVTSTDLPASFFKESIISGDEQKALSSGQPVEKIYKDPSSGDHYLVYGKPAINKNTLYGGVYILSSIEDVYRSVQNVRYLLVLSGVGALFLALGFTFVFSRKLSAPLVKMEKATRKIAKGDLDTRVILTSKDEVGSLAQAINDLARDLKRYRDTRQEFFANISHELRTPMTYLEGYAKVLREGLYQSEEEKIQYLDIIQLESSRLTRLIQDLFDLSKMEEGKYALHLEWVDLTEPLESVILKMKVKARDKGLDFYTDVDNHDDLPFVYGDGLRLEQIFFNLIDNAIRYTEKGMITIRMSAGNQDNVVIEIEDTGKGIPEDELPFIFERFYRVEKSRSRQYGGTGLGLAIVKKLVEIQGGQIQVFSQLGKGTRFEIKFPTSSKKKIREGEQ